MKLRFALIGLGVVAIATTARAIEFGWQPLPDGGIEYIVRVEPTMLDAFREHGFSSTVPAGTQEIRLIRLVVGEDKLPNEATALPAAPITAPMSPGNDALPPNSASDGGKTASKATPSTGNEPTAFSEPSEAKPIGNPLFNGKTSILSTPADRDRAQQPAAPEVVQQPQLGVNESAGDKNTVLKVETPEPQPWLPLMLALVALFASLGANAYLVWIHQTLRANYRSLVSRMRGETATA